MPRTLWLFPDAEFADVVFGSTTERKSTTVSKKGLDGAITRPGGAAGAAAGAPSSNPQKQIGADVAFIITNAVHELAQAVDSCDFHGYADLFCEDGTCEVGGRTKKGHKDIGDLAASMAQRYPGCQTWVGNVVLKKREGGVAAIKARSYYKVCSAANGGIVSMGVNEDMFEKREGMWRVFRRKTLPAAGRAPSAR